jgi:hypothetical protein
MDDTYKKHVISKIDAHQLKLKTIFSNIIKIIYDKLNERENEIYSSKLHNDIDYSDYNINQYYDINYEELNKNYYDFNKWKGLNVYDIFSIIPKNKYSKSIILPFVYLQFYKNNVYLNDEQIFKVNFPFIIGHRIKICKYVDSNVHLFIFMDNLKYNDDYVFKYNDDNNNVYNYSKNHKIVENNKAKEYYKYIFLLTLFFLFSLLIIHAFLLV